MADLSLFGAVSLDVNCLSSQSCPCGFLRGKFVQSTDRGQVTNCCHIVLLCLLIVKGVGSRMPIIGPVHWQYIKLF